MLITRREPDVKRALGPRLLGGDRVTTLTNGDEIVPPMLEDIGPAQSNITFETVIVRNDIGSQFCETLSAAAGEEPSEFRLEQSRQVAVAPGRMRAAIT